MSEPGKINLARLRASHDAMGGTVRVKHDELVALVEAASAANEVLPDALAVLQLHMSPEVRLETQRRLLDALVRLDNALSVFSFEDSK